MACVGAFSNLLFIVIIIANILIAIIQELRAKKLVDSLSLLSVPHAKVIRDGKEREVPVEDLVLDDVICLYAGQQICSDAIILEGEAEVNESLLTGESDQSIKCRVTRYYPAALLSAVSVMQKWSM